MYFYNFHKIWCGGILSFMVISYHGGEFFKITFSDITLAVNPVSKDSKLKKSKFGADIAFISLNDKDFNGVDQVTHGDKVPFVVSSPGEYETHKVFVRGIKSSSTYGGSERLNTIYRITLEGINICFLGAIDTRKISAETKEALNGIDILFIPIGGDGVLTASDAHGLAVGLEPKIIIPMHYGEIAGEIENKEEALPAFLKEEGSKNGKPVDKLTIKKKDLEGKEGEIVVLAS